MQNAVINPHVFQAITVNNLDLVRKRYDFFKCWTSLLDVLTQSKEAAHYLEAGLKPHLVSKLHLDFNQYPFHPLENLDSILDGKVSDSGMIVNIDDGSLEVPVNAAVVWCNLDI